MKKAMFLILFVLLVGTLSAQTFHEYRIDDNNRFRLVGMPQFNGYTLVHALEGGIGYALCRHVGISPENSFWVTVAAKVAIEVIYDGFGNDYPFGIEYDPDGMDFADIAAGALGAALAYFGERQYLICKRLRIASTGRMLAVAIEL